MRRRRPELNGVPTTLPEFRGSDWPGATWQERFDAWRAALHAHEREHGWPGGTLDILMRTIYVRCRHHGSRLPLGVSSYFGLPPER